MPEVGFHAILVAGVESFAMAGRGFSPSVFGNGYHTLQFALVGACLSLLST